MKNRLIFLAQACAVVLVFGALGTAVAHSTIWDDLPNPENNNWNGDDHTNHFYMRSGDDFFSNKDQHAVDEELTEAGDDGDFGTMGEGPDVLAGQGGSDRQSCGTDCDTVISGGKGSDDVTGGSGNDSMSGGLYQDEVHGNEGDDDIYDDDGAPDQIHGGDGQDTCDVDLQQDSWDSCVEY